MKNIVIFGAGRSSVIMIQYLLKHAAMNEWLVTVADMNLESARAKLQNHASGRAIQCDINDDEERRRLIASADIVVSMLPSHLHLIVAEDCLAIGRDLATASYLSDDMKKMDAEVAAKGLIFANELGLDPGIDHMSAMELIHRIKKNGGTITSFKSYTGGLVAKESDDNPWHYKVSWNPRNVVLAGQGLSQFLQNGQVRYVPYHSLFEESTEVDVVGHGQYSMYYNRDSVKYIGLYDLEGVQDMIRGTLRGKGYTNAWSVLVALGMTDDTTMLNLESGFSLRDFSVQFLKQHSGDFLKDLEATIGRLLSEQAWNCIDWLGLFSEEKVPLHHPSAAQVLEYVIVNKWVLRQSDKDLVVMQHEITYEAAGQNKTIRSTLYREGRNAIETAMAETVGLPLAIYVRLRLMGHFTRTGTIIPVHPDIYTPILKELDVLGIRFTETLHG